MPVFFPAKRPFDRFARKSTDYFPLRSIQRTEVVQMRWLRFDSSMGIVLLAVLSLVASGCSSEPVVIEATPDQQKIFADEYAEEMQARN